MDDKKNRPIDQIDREFLQLMHEMGLEKQAERMLKAMQGLFDAEKMEPGHEKTVMVASCLTELFLTMPSIYDVFCHANPYLQNEEQRLGGIRAAMMMMFAPDPPQPKVNEASPFPGDLPNTLSN